ncbi:galactosylceramide sulfotransferase-like isoform X2 [Amphiura filiformis]|uniref:galactosylceramide sulfotransferase-like isoform X2 n=1 Tax=Amphiura filiformis TaxID=82378 RepID=UPI003B218023
MLTSAQERHLLCLECLARATKRLRIFSSVFIVCCLIFSSAIYLNSGTVQQDNLIQMTSNRTATQLVGTRRLVECAPVQRIVFLKTHKTAGTSIGTILQRYGYTRNLSFAIPAKNTPVFDCCRYFKRSDVFLYKKQESELGDESDDGGGTNTFDMLTNHAVYLRPEMDAIVPDALYITSVRDPVDQFESAFVYFDIANQAEIAKVKNPIATFFTNPQHYKQKISYGGRQVQNGQLYDLGLSTEHFLDPFYVKYKIRQLDNEFDLVFVKEYFDESLILMKKLFCWGIDDILYIPKRIANFRFNISENLRETIRKWNHADVLLYEHFNRTLWRKIEEYGAEFWRDLDEFRRRMEEVSSLCETKKVDKDNVHHLSIVELQNKSEFCQNLYRMDGEYVKLIRWNMVPMRSNFSDNATTTNMTKVQSGNPRDKPTLQKKVKPRNSISTNRRKSKPVIVKKHGTSKRIIKVTKKRVKH